MTVERAQSLLDHTLYTGGHFMMTPQGPHLNAGTIQSFQQAAFYCAKAKKKYKNVGLGLLINDLGTVCSSAGCSVHGPIQGEIALPTQYLEIMHEVGIAPSTLKIFREKHIRNRAKKLLHKELGRNKNILYVEGGYVYQEPARTAAIILTRQSCEDKYGIPACPLIMSAYSIEQQRLGFKSSINFYYVGKDNYLNVTNPYIIEKGSYLAESFGLKFKTKNIYLFDDGSVSTSMGVQDDLFRQ